MSPLDGGVFFCNITDDHHQDEEVNHWTAIATMLAHSSIGAENFNRSISSHETQNESTMHYDIAAHYTAQGIPLSGMAARDLPRPQGPREVMFSERLALASFAAPICSFTLLLLRQGGLVLHVIGADIWASFGCLIHYALSSVETN